MTAQIVGDLRTLVTRRAGLKRRVALLVSDGALRASLEQNGCAVLADPESLDALAAFEPEVVVAFDGFAADGAEGFARLARAVPQAELIFSFANAASAGLLVRSLLGTTPAPSSSEPDVRAWLRSAGYVVKSRDVVVTPHVASGLSADTEAALRQVLEQVNPDAAADRLLLVAARGVEASPVERTPGLTSVVLSGGEAHALEGTARSVAGQLQKPLELVVVTPLAESVLEDALKTARGRAGLELTVLAGAAAEPLARTNAGLARARGQYVCCLEGGELLERSHLAALVKRLQDGTAAWALSGAAGLERFELRAWLEAGAVQRGRYLVDRDRLGTFPLQFAEGVALGEAMLFCRLAALFPPSFVPAAPTLDSPRVVASSPDALREALQARPLRTLSALDLRPPVPIDVVAEIEARVAARNETAGKLFTRAREVLERVRDAAEKAKADANAERKGRG